MRTMDVDGREVNNFILETECSASMRGRVGGECVIQEENIMNGLMEDVAEDWCFMNTKMLVKSELRVFNQLFLRPHPTK
jgi:hypothetical protein